jgi:hypothetical protein
MGLYFRGGENLFVELSGNQSVLSCYRSSERLDDSSVLSFERVERFIVVSFKVVGGTSEGSW